MRTVASQMKDAVGNSVTIRIGGAATDGRDVVFSASGRTITFHGFLKAYVEDIDDASKRKDDAETRLPNLVQGAAVSAATLTPEGHETKPPARYTEATLIKELEDREIGRPSTYASIIGTILNRGYVYKKGTALVPAWLAFSVIRLLEEHFPRQVSYEFTADMEDVLDEIAGGRKDRATELGEFYYGAGDVGRPQDAGDRARRDRRQGDGDLPDRRGHRPPRGPLRPVRRGPGARGRRRRSGARQRARRPAARRAHRGQGQGAAGQPGRRGAGGGQPPRHRPPDRGQERPLRPLRHRAAARGRAQVGQAAHGLALQVDDPRHGHARAGASGSSTCRASSASTRTAPRSPRRTAATGPTSRRAPTRAR